MKILNAIISFSISTSLVLSSHTAYGNSEQCRIAFLPVATAATQLTTSITVREHYRKMGTLKSEQEIDKLKAEDKDLYLSMLALDYSRAQEIMRLFATFPIIISPQVLKEFTSVRRVSERSLKDYLESTRSTERKEISTTIANYIISTLGVTRSREFILTDDLENLDSTYKFDELKKQQKVVEDLGLPSTMVKEVAQFFNKLHYSSSEVDFVVSLIYRNFDKIAQAAEPLTPKQTSAIDHAQLWGSGASPVAGVLYYLSAVAGVDLGADLFLTGSLSSLGLLASVVSSLMVFSMFSPSFAEKISISYQLTKLKISKNSKKKREDIKQEMLILSGLDPKSIKALPTVRQLKKNSSSSQSKNFIPALLDGNVLAYPDVDLVLLENSFETKISIEDINSLEPKFADIDELNSNPFALQSFGKELAAPQFLIIGREEILTARFSEINEDFTNLLLLIRKAKTEKDRIALVNEKIKLLAALTAYSQENSSSWKYLNSLKKAVERHSTYLNEVLVPLAPDSQRQITTASDNFSLMLQQIEEQVKSLTLRAESIDALMKTLRG